MMRRYLLIVAVAMVSGGNLYALSVDKGNRATVEVPETQEAPAVHNYQAAEKAVKKKAPPVSTFTPTEKISADSAVSFPVDI